MTESMRVDGAALRMRFLVAHRKPEHPAQLVSKWNLCTLSGNDRNSQVRNASFTHGAGDGLHRRAQSAEQRRQLPGAFGFPPLLHHKTGHSDHVGVEGPSFGHSGR